VNSPARLSTGRQETTPVPVQTSTLDCPQLSSTGEISELEPGGLSSPYQQESGRFSDGGVVERARFTAELWCVISGTVRS
jgi:hypothetical protein